MNAPDAPQRVELRAEVAKQL
ncbi:MAG: hypothetical protein JWL91_82, partial [Sphingomonas bacterium]|nr:hypothetical protein [Sphingomonas bacterium]